MAAVGDGATPATTTTTTSTPATTAGEHHHHDGGKGWSTGLLQFTEDWQSFFFGVFCTPLLAVENKFKVSKEADIPDAHKGFLHDAGCAHGDTGRFLHLLLLGCCPCVYVLWRHQIRTKYGIGGKGWIPDCFAWCCCMPFAVMQDAREHKAHSV